MKRISVKIYLPSSIWKTEGGVKKRQGEDPSSPGYSWCLYLLSIIISQCMIILFLNMDPIFIHRKMEQVMFLPASRGVDPWKTEWICEDYNLLSPSGKIFKASAMAEIKTWDVCGFGPIWTSTGRKFIVRRKGWFPSHILNDLLQKSFK